MQPIQQNQGIIFASMRPEETAIFKISTDGQETQLTSERKYPVHPMPSPDGEYLVYSGIQAGVQSLYITHLASGKEQKLTTGTCFEDNPSFDSEGNLYFNSNIEEITHIYRAPFNPKGIDIRSAEKITDGPGNHFSFSISPCGKYIVFCSNRDNLESFQGSQPSPTYMSGQLYLMEIRDPKNVQPLTAQQGTNKPWEGTPAWSSCGNYIFYYSTANSEKHNPQLFRYNITNKTSTSLTNATSKALEPFICEDKLFFSYQKDPAKRWKIKCLKAFQESPQIEKVMIQSKRQFWSPKPIKDGYLIAVGTIVKKISSSIFPGYRSLPHGEGNICVDQGTVEGMTFHAVRRCFPVMLKNETVAAIDLEFKRILVSKLDGSDEQVLYESPKGIFGLDSDGDGNLVTTEGIPFSPGEKHIILLRGNQKTNLTEQYGKHANGWPSMTSDGRYVVFNRLEDQHRKLFLIDRIEKTLHQITHDDRDDLMPTISRDGRTIVFSSTKDRKEYQLRMIKLNDSYQGDIQILTSQHVDMHSSISEDGKQIIFSSDRGGLTEETPQTRYFAPQRYGNIWHMDIESRRLCKITNCSSENSNPSWVRV